LHPNSKLGKICIYGEYQKILDLFHPSNARFAEIKTTKFDKKMSSFWAHKFWQTFQRTILILYPIELNFFVVFSCVLLVRKNIKRAKEIEKNSESKRKEKRST